MKVRNICKVRPYLQGKKNHLWILYFCMCTCGHTGILEDAGGQRTTSDVCCQVPLIHTGFPHWPEMYHVGQASRSRSFHGSTCLYNPFCHCWDYRSTSFYHTFSMDSEVPNSWPYTSKTSAVVCVCVYTFFSVGSCRDTEDRIFLNCPPPLGHRDKVTLTLELTISARKPQGSVCLIPSDVCLYAWCLLFVCFCISAEYFNSDLMHVQQVS